MTRAMRYMNGYACLAADCPDNCCVSWRVPVAEAHLELLRQAMSEPADLELFERAVEMMPEDKRTPQTAARLKLDDDHRCMFLDEQRLCSLHRRFGDEMLPDACATYPRMVGLVDERRELAGSLAWPEVARRALTTDDGTDLVEVEPEATGRGWISQELRGGAEAAARLDIVRDAMYEILSTRLYPLSSRLFAVTHFGYQLHDLVAERGEPDKLLAVVAPHVGPENIGKLHAMLSSAPPEGAFGLSCVLQLLSGPLSTSNSQRFVDLAQEVLTSFAGATSIHEFWQTYTERRQALAEGAAARVDRLVFNYARHCCMAEWYSSSAGLRMFVQQLLLRVTTLRFLMLGHPSMAGLEPDRVDELGVEIFYSFAGTTERNLLVTTGFLEIASQTMPTFFHAAPLLRV